MGKIPKPVLKLDDERLEKFWSFICERQNIYWRRGAGEPRPWTKDPILDKFLFCNVYRELDRGTQFCMNTVMWKYKTHEELLFRVIMYRLFNEPMTYELIFKHLDKYNGHKVGTMLDRKHEAGIRIFRSAWMTSAAGMNGKSKAYVYCRDMQLVYNNIKKIAAKVLAESTMEGAWKVIKEIKWLGPFVSYQIVLDLSYARVFCSLWTDFHTWVYPGPGCLKGISWLMGYDPIKSAGSGKFREGITNNDITSIVRHLTDNQEKYFKKYGLKFKRWDNKRLNIHNCEFALCEYQKYMRASRGGKKKHFIPSTQLALLGM